jgi:hypothetical protein
MISFWNKEMTTNFLCQVEGYDLPPMLGSQIRIVALTTMQRSWFLVLSFEMKKKLHGVSYTGPSFFRCSDMYAESLTTTTTMLTATVPNWSSFELKITENPYICKHFGLWPQLMLFLQLLWVLTISTAKFAEIFFWPRMHFAKKAWPHKCAYACEGLWCQIHKLFQQQQQRRSTIFYC